MLLVAFPSIFFNKLAKQVGKAMSSSQHGARIFWQNQKLGIFRQESTAFLSKTFQLSSTPKAAPRQISVVLCMYSQKEMDGQKKWVDFQHVPKKKYLIPDFIPWFFVLKCQPNSFHLLKDLTFFMYFVQHTEGFFSELLDQLWSGQVGWDFLQIGIYWIKDRNPGETGDIFHGCIK